MCSTTYQKCCKLCLGDVTLACSRPVGRGAGRRCLQLNMRHRTGPIVRERDLQRQPQTGRAEPGFGAFAQVDPVREVRTRPVRPPTHPGWGAPRPTTHPPCPTTSCPRGAQRREIFTKPPETTHPTKPASAKGPIHQVQRQSELGNRRLLSSV